MSTIIKMLMLSLMELRLIAKIRSIKDYKSMFKDESLSVLRVSESVKENKKNSKDTDSIKNEDYDADEILGKKQPFLIQQKYIKLLKTKENRIVIKTKNLEISISHLIPKKTPMNLKNCIIIIFNMKIWEIKIRIYQLENILIWLI